MKKGFTLIELLAVIVILAIIALIATPIVLSIIEETKESAVLRSAEYYLSTVELGVAKKNLTAGGSFSPNVCEVQSNGNLLCDGTEILEVELNGEVPSTGTITFNKGKIVAASLTLSNKTIAKDGNGKLAFVEDSLKDNVPLLCTAIAPIEQSLYENTENRVVSSVVGVQATRETPYAKGAVYKCDLGDGERIFYVLKDTEDTVSLLMEENIGDTLAWDGAISYLNTQTGGWTKLFDENGTVSLPTYDDVSEVEQLDWLRTNLVDYLGYWTSTPSAWVVWCDGGCSMAEAPTDYDIGTGIRPVITISKENIGL